MRFHKRFYDYVTTFEGTKRWRKIFIGRRYIASIIGCVFLLSMALLLFFVNNSGNLVNYPVGVVAIILAVILFRFSRTYRRKSLQTLEAATPEAQPINPFNIAHPSTRGMFGVPTVVSDDERVVAPTPPITMRGMDAISRPSITGGETNDQSVNTFICTDHQIICAMIGYEDIPEGIDRGFTNSSDDIIRNFQFTYFHKDVWQNIADNALKPGLVDFIAHHFSYAFPYSSITSIKPATHELLNHCLDIQLVDGQTFSYTFMNPKDRVAILEQLKGCVNVVEG